MHFFSNILPFGVVHGQDYSGGCNHLMWPTQVTVKLPLSILYVLEFHMTGAVMAFVHGSKSGQFEVAHRHI